MKVKVISRNPDEYLRETKFDIHKVPRNYSPSLHPFQQNREYVRALNATKLDRVFAKPFVGVLDGHREGVHCLAKHPNQLSVLASGAYDGEIRIWSLSSKTCLFDVQAHNGFTRGLCIDPEGRRLYSVGDDQQIKIWPLNNILLQDKPSTSKECCEPEMTILAKNMLRDVTHSYDKAQFATCGEGVNVYDHMSTMPIVSYDWGVDTVYKVQYNPVEPELLGAVASDRSIILYDSRQNVPLRKVVLKLASNAIAWNPMEAYSFTVANEDYNLYSFDMRYLSQPTQVHMDHTEAVLDVDYAPTGKEFVSASYDKSIRIFPFGKGRSRDVYHTKRMQRVMCVRWSFDNKFIASGSDEMNIRLWKSNASEKMGTLAPREERAKRYNDKLKERFAHHPEIKRISRHRHVPKHIFSANKEHTIIKTAEKRKEANRRKHTKPGTVPYVPERQKHVVKEQE